MGSLLSVAGYFGPVTRIVYTKLKPEEEIIKAIVLFVPKQLLFCIPERLVIVSNDHGLKLNG